MDRGTRAVLALGVLGLAGVLAAALVSAGARAESARPFVPADGALVLARVPQGGDGDEAGWRARLARDPRDLVAATALARRYVEAARAQADPRFLGRAQAVLAPWWGRADAPASALVLEATIRQSNHEFPAALALLDRVVALAPDDVQAQLTRATVLVVLARYEEARAACAGVARRAPGVIAATCAAGVDGATGQARAAYDRLAAEVAAAGARDPAIAAWAESALGELAERLGDTAAAERHFRAALAADGDDGYARAALADLWLDAGRAADVIALLAGREDADALLLRLAIAERQTGAAAAVVHERLLAERFAAMHARGDRIHLREEARFRLELGGDACAALALASEDWQVQRELADARVVLVAAVACGGAAAKTAAAPVLAWRRTNRVEHPRLAELAARLEDGR